MRASGDQVTAAPAASATAARHVVISSFDSPDNPHYRGGGAAVIEMLAQRLAAHFEVTVVTTARRGETACLHGVRYLRLPVGWAGPRGGQLLFHALLPLMALRMRHDLWIESFTPPFSTSFLPIFSRARVAGFAQNLCGEEMWHRYRIPFFLIERLGLRYYRDFVVLNPADYARVRRYSPASTIRLIPNCIDLPPVDDQLIGRGSYILFLGRIDIREKGLDLLLAAYERSKPAMPLLIAGSGTQREERRLRALLDASGCHARWVGHVTGRRKQQLLKDSAFMVLPSRYEAFGLAALESMSYGKPVVHFNLPSLRWMKGDIRVPLFDAGALGREMHSVANDGAARRRLGQAALAAAQRYGRDQTGDRYLRFASELLDEPCPGGRRECDPAWP